MAASYVRRARFEGLMIDFVLAVDTRSYLQRMASTKVRDHHIERLGAVIAECHFEIQRLVPGRDVARRACRGARWPRLAV